VYLYKVAMRPPESPEVKAVGNAFQNIGRGRLRFAEFGFDPYAALSPEALAVLTLNIKSVTSSGITSASRMPLSLSMPPMPVLARLCR
jgi:hypothetical protein